MKICYLTDNMNPEHGGGRYASDLINAVKRAGQEAIVLKRDNDSFGGAPILKSGFGLFIAVPKVARYFKNCDVIHALDGYPHGIIAALANRKLRKKLILTTTGTFSVAPLYSFWKSPLLKWAYRKADVIIAISHYTRDEILKKIKLADIGIINPGINFEKFYKIHEDSSENFILSVGALKFRKGYHVSIPAFALAKKEIPDLKYKIVGNQKDGAYFDLLKKLAIKYDVQNDIEFLTGLNDKSLSDLYRRAKLFILTSINENYHFEGFGIVFLEAAAASLPAIGTLNNGIEDSVKNGYSGVLVPQNNVKATSGMIVKLLKNEILRKELSLNALEWAKKHDWGKLIANYIKIYQS